MLRSIQNWLNLVAPRAKRSAVPARMRSAHARVEFLESRCMLSFTVLTDGDFGLTRHYGDSLVLSGITNSHQPSLELPKFEIMPETADGGLIPIPNEPWQPEVKPVAPSDPATANLPRAVAPATPPANSGAMNPPPAHQEQNNSTQPIPDVVPEEPSGGLVDLGTETGLEDPGDSSPLNDPSPRELRSVMQLLAGLKYPVGGGESSATIDRPLADFDPQGRRLESVLSEADGGVVAIAVNEIVDELEAARTTLPSIAEESLLEIAVQMDRSAGRFQAFEVLTLEEPTLPVREIRPTVIQHPQSDPAAVNFEGVSEMEPTELPTQSSSRQTSSLQSSSNAPVAVADGRSGSTWSLTIALVTFGFVLQLLRDRRGERLKAQAASWWESLFVVTVGKPIRPRQRRSFSPPQ